MRLWNWDPESLEAEGVKLKAMGPGGRCRRWGQTEMEQGERGPGRSREGRHIGFCPLPLPISSLRSPAGLGLLCVAWMFPGPCAPASLSWFLFLEALIKTLFISVVFTVSCSPEMINNKMKTPDEKGLSFGSLKAGV